MKAIDRTEILDYVTYNERRESIRGDALRAKSERRILVGEHFTFLFENRETVRYQIQEMMRVEQIVREADIEHEIRTYNELLHPKGSLGCTLLIGIEEEAERDEKLRQWLGLNEHIYAELPNGSRVQPSWDPRQVGEGRLSSVQYLKFDFGTEPPVRLGIDMPGIEVAAELSQSQRAALRADLAAE